MNVLIVDDNKIARTIMKQLASQVKDMVVAGESANAIDAYNLLQEQPVDLVFLDIEMPGINGLELTKSLGNKKPIIIFTTSKKLRNTYNSKDSRRTITCIQVYKSAPVLYSCRIKD